MKIPSLALVIALAALATGTTVAPPANACGPFAPEDRARMIVRRHFAALNAHDRAALLALWSPNATVVSGDPTVVEPIDHAASRWLTTKREVSFHITKFDVDPDDQFVVAHVAVLFGARDFEDTMLLVPTRAGWRIAGETSHAQPIPTHY